MESVYTLWQKLSAEEKVHMFARQMNEFSINGDNIGPCHCEKCNILGHFDHEMAKAFPVEFYWCEECNDSYCENCINLEMYENTSKCDSCNEKEKKKNAISSHTHVKTYELIRDNDLERIKYLVEIGGNFTNDSSYLAWAAEFGHLEMAKYFVSLGASVSAANNLALKWAARKGQLEMVKYLISQGAKDNNREASKMAKDYDHECVISYLKSIKK